MVAETIPEDIKEFVLQHIDSIADLEALLLLRRDPQKKWRATDAARRLYINERDSIEVMARLHARGFLALEGDAYFYHSSSPDLARTVDRVAEFYAKHLIPITNLIHTKPASRIREFADAFKLRKDD